jgi:hypothetical protein
MHSVSSRASDQGQCRLKSLLIFDLFYANYTEQDFEFKLGAPMKTIKTFFIWVFFIALFLLAVATIRPYWQKYWIQKDMETAAIYGTKHSAEDTMALLGKKMKEEGRSFTGQDFDLSKDENKKVTITLHYADQIGLFGVELKELQFTVVATASEIKEYY